MPAPAFGHFNGPKLAQAREAAGMSRAQLAKAVGVKPDVVGLWEGRGVTPAAHHLPKVAAAVGLDVFDLYSPPEGVDGLAALRMRAGLSQRRLAQLMSTPQTTLSGWERGTSPLPEGRVSQYAHALSATVDEVMAAANAVRPDSPSAEPALADKRAATRPEVEKRLSPPAHLIFVYDAVPGKPEACEAAQGAFSRVYSPQGVDIRVSDGRGDEAVMAEGVARLQAVGIRNWITHHEFRVMHNGSPIFSLRCQIAPLDTTKKAVFNQLLTELITRSLLKGEELSRRRSSPQEFEDTIVLPTESFMDCAPLIVTTPADYYDWLCDQVEPYAPYGFIVYDMSRGSFVLATVSRDHDRITVGDKSAKVSDLHVSGGTTLGELLDKFQAGAST